jgi:hypothetical protein
VRFRGGFESIAESRAKAKAAKDRWLMFEAESGSRCEAGVGGPPGSQGPLLKVCGRWPGPGQSPLAVLSFKGVDTWEVIRGRATLPRVGKCCPPQDDASPSCKLALE